MRDPQGNAGDTKERLLAVALEILEREGGGGLTIRNIAKHGGVSLSIVNHHYQSKRGLLDACKSHFYEGLGRVVADIVAATGQLSGKEIVERSVRACWAFVRANIPLTRMLAGDVMAEGQLIDSYGDYDKRPALSTGVAVLAPRLGLTVELARVRLQAMAVLVTRFAISSDAELSSLFGLDADAAVRAAEEHLVDMGKLLLVGQ